MTTQGLKIKIRCNICCIEYVTYLSGECKPGETIDDVSNESLNKVVTDHKKLSPNCKAEVSDLIALSCERTTN